MNGTGITGVQRAQEGGRACYAPSTHLSAEQARARCSGLVLQLGLLFTARAASQLHFSALWLGFQPVCCPESLQSLTLTN